MSQPCGMDPPWSAVEEMVRAYRSRLQVFDAAHELFHYRDAVQYGRKLAIYGSVLRGAGKRVGSLLDVGCGLGNLLTSYTPVDRYLGVDVVPELVALAQKTYPQYTFLSADIMEVDLPRHDTATLIGALGTSPSPMDLLKRTSDLAHTHLVFDYLPTTGSAEGVSWLRTILPQRIDDLLLQEGWSTLRSIRVGSSAVVVMCERK